MNGGTPDGRAPAREPSGSAAGPLGDDDAGLEALLIERLESGKFVTMTRDEFRRLNEEIAAELMARKKAHRGGR